MQRSSDSIAALASALAKAQIELVNPEKSLVATIYPEGTGQDGRSFNYASLASGLEIVRKTLGQHEIAVMQTTAIDQPAGVINLTTVLAHSSGEWIASDWPVCAVAESTTPHRMGAALTYARRYALFTLVGIAGEDDLDAPDLQATPTSQKAPASQTPTPKRPNGTGNGHLNRGRLGHRRDGKGLTTVADTTRILAPEESAILCNRLLAELANLGSPDDAALWARRSLAEKNKLTNNDAENVEASFRAKLETLAAHPRDSLEILAKAAAGNDVNEAKKKDEQPLTIASRVARIPPTARRPRRIVKSAGARGQPATESQQTKAIDKSVLTLPEPRRIRDREHIKYVAKQPCLVCGRAPCDAHHLRFTQSRALGRKVSDEFAVPLCRGHHREVHRCGEEAAWWRKLGIDPTTTARTLWLESHPLPFGRGQEHREDASTASSRLKRSEEESSRT